MDNTPSLSIPSEDSSRKGRSTTPSSASRSASQTRSRSRASGSYDTHRLSTQDNVWSQDKETKHKKIMDKVFGHKLVPGFLK